MAKFVNILVLIDKVEEKNQFVIVRNRLLTDTLGPGIHYIA